MSAPRSDAIRPRSDIPGAAATGAKMLFVASSGGHLSELVRLADRLRPHPDSLWVTFRTVQTEQMLRGRRVEYLPYIGPRDWRGTARSVPYFRRILARERFDAVLSTGAAVATAALGAARLARVPATYVESLGRVIRPSRTGRILEWMPGVELRTQHTAAAGRRWGLHTSVLDDFRSVPAAPRESRRLFVTLGTIRPYRFDTLIDAVLATGLADESTVWQLGSTTRDDLPGHVADYLSPAEFADAARSADVVVSHAGVGTLLEMLSLGVYPVMVVRRAGRGEHVDDHQEQIADLVNARDLGRGIEVASLDAALVDEAAGRGIRDTTVPEFEPVRPEH